MKRTKMKENGGATERVNGLKIVEKKKKCK